MQLGLESKNFLVNLGGLRFFIFLQCSLIPILVFLAIFPWSCVRCSIWLNKKVHSIFFNALLAFIDSTFLVIILPGLLNIREVYYGHLEMDKSFIFSIVFLSALLVELVGVSIYLRCKRNQLDDEAPRKRCGYVFEELNYKIRGGWALTYPILYQIRFVILAGAAIFLGRYLVYQILAVLLITIIIVAVLGYAHPHRVVS